jgi:hypothetical protein
MQTKDRAGRGQNWLENLKERISRAHTSAFLPLPNTIKALANSIIKSFFHPSADCMGPRKLL